MWSSPDVVGLFSNNVVSFSSNVVLRGPLFSINLVSKPRMLSVRSDYVLSSLQVALGTICTHAPGDSQHAWLIVPSGRKLGNIIPGNMFNALKQVENPSGVHP